MKRLTSLLHLSLVTFLATTALLNGCNQACPSPATGPGEKDTHTIQASVRVALDACAENRHVVSGNGEFATLDCFGGDAGTLRILLPRKQWQSMKQDGVGLVNAGPGK